MRYFTAIPLPLAVKDRLTSLCSGVPGAKWADPDQMHITLRFFGDVDGVAATDIAEALDGVRGDPFELDLASIGYFGTGHRLHTLWVGVAESCKAGWIVPCPRSSAPKRSENFTPM